MIKVFNKLLTVLKAWLYNVIIEQLELWILCESFVSNLQTQIAILQIIFRGHILLNWNTHSADL